MTGGLFLWGLVALLQMVFLPGYLLLRTLRLRGGVVESLLVTFALSTMANYLLVNLLVAIKLYTFRVVCGIIVAECLVCLVLWWRDADRECWLRSVESYRGAIAGWMGLGSLERAVVVIFLVAGFYCLFSTAYASTVSWQDGAFQLWDNVFSWNRWATEWSHNKHPFHTFHYPQLLPINSSIVYVLAGTNAVEAFNKLFFLCFPLGIYLCLLDLGLRRKAPGFWIGIPFIYLAYMYMTPPGPSDGYADVPVTFMILLSLYCMLLVSEQTDKHVAFRWTMLAGFLAGAALVTKQTGFYLIGALPLLLWLIPLQTPLMSKKEKWATAIMAVSLAMSVSIPWYIFKQFQIWHGKELSEIVGAQAAQQGRGMLERMEHALLITGETFGRVQAITVAVLALAAIGVAKTWRWVIIWIIIPGSLFWSVTTSYDLRNATFFVTLGSVSAGLTLAWVLARLSAGTKQWPAGLRRTGLALGCVGLVFAVSFLPAVASDSLKYRNDMAQREIGMPALNAAIYQLLFSGKITRPIVTNYFIMPFIPLLNDYIAYDGLTDPKTFEEALRVHKPEYIAVMHPRVDYGAMSEDIIADKVAKGEWSIAVRGPSFVILEPHDPPLAVADRKLPFGSYKILEGLGAEEPGNLPAYPLLRWGLGPATKLEFDSTGTGPMILAMDCIRPMTSNLEIEIKLNGSRLAVAYLHDVSWPIHKEYQMTPVAGKNHLEILYNTWDTHTEPRPLALLYGSLKIMPK